jgi:hypothetical protein
MHGTCRTRRDALLGSIDVHGGRTQHTSVGMAGDQAFMRTAERDDRPDIPVQVLVNPNTLGCSRVVSFDGSDRLVPRSLVLPLG